MIDLPALANVLHAHQPRSAPLGGTVCACGMTFKAVDARAWHRHAAAMVANTLAAAREDSEDARRFRWLCDERGLGFAYDEKRYGISTAKWGDWPDDLREAVDAAMRGYAARSTDAERSRD